MIRQATDADMSILMELAFEFHKAARYKRHATFETSLGSWETWLLRCIADPNYLCLIAFSKDKPAGFLTGLSFPAYWNVDIIAVHETAFWVEPTNRGAGIGSELLDAFCSWGKRKGASVVAAGSTVHMSPKKMGTLLLRHGFNLEERIYTKKVS